ncbi:MAG TPA: methylmalonyl-CoA epimerase [Polyangia bacterium]|jgi:methylmalonyl-CoA/ethylmalonyl-CoA epimerase
MKVSRIDHVAMAVPDIDQALAALAPLGLRAAPAELVAAQRTLAAMIPTGETAIELIAPAGNEGLARFLEKKGPGLHHICLAVEDLAQALAELKANGVRLIDETPRPGARGHLVAFIHPSATGGVLFELCQHGGEQP